MIIVSLSRTEVKKLPVGKFLYHVKKEVTPNLDLSCIQKIFNNVKTRHPRLG